MPILSEVEQLVRETVIAVIEKDRHPADPSEVDKLAFAIALSDPLTTEHGRRVLRPEHFDEAELDGYRQAARVVLALQQTVAPA